MKKVFVHPDTYTLVDDEIYGEVSGYKWRLDKDGYAIAWTKQVNKQRKLIKLHRLVTGTLHAGRGVIIDHEDGDKLNNTKANLRICDNKGNSRNRKVSSSKGSSKYKGVYKSRDKYRARIFHEGKNINIGTYETEEEAAKAYDSKALELHGEFANTNIK